MKALVLHGTDNDHTGNWFPWLKEELEKLGHQVWVPDLPVAKKPNVERWSKFLLENNSDFEGWLTVGHSSGAVEILDLLQKLPEGQKVAAAIFVAVFQGDLGWHALEELADVEYDFEKISRNARQKIVVHSDDDPLCSFEGAKKIAKKIDAEFIGMRGMKHFSTGTDPRFNKFPELLEIIKQKLLV